MDFSEIQSLVFQEYKKNGYLNNFSFIECPYCFRKISLKEMSDIAEIGLFTEEVGECLDAIRRKKDVSEECADIIIRVMNFCNRKNINIESKIIDKNNRNKKRKKLHSKVI